MPAVQHGAVEGNVGQCLGVSSPRAGALLFISKLPASCQGVRSRLGGLQGMPGILPRAWVEGWQMAGELGTGEQGRTRDTFQPRQL